jgi:hypothetical protein
MAEVAKRLVGILKVTVLRACFRRRHGWRQLNQPFWIHGEAAHHLERGCRVFFPNRDGAVQPRTDDPFPEYILHVEQVIVAHIKRKLLHRSAFLGTDPPRCAKIRDERAGICVVVYHGARHDTNDWSPS